MGWTVVRHAVWGRRWYGGKYLTNANALWAKYGDNYQDLTDLVNSEENITHWNVNDMPRSGSLVHFKGSGNNVGVVLNDLQYVLNQNSKYSVVLPDSKLVEVTKSDVLFAIPNFINASKMKQLFKDLIITPERLSVLVYTLNITLHYTSVIQSILSKRNIIESSFLSLAQIDNQLSLQLDHFVAMALRKNVSLQRFVEPSLNAIAIPSLLLSFHLHLLSDPIKFRYNNYRFGNSTESVFSVLKPLELITSNYYLNPISLVSQLQLISSKDSAELKLRYHHILHNSNSFQLIKTYRNDTDFRDLIQFIKYTILNPHNILLAKLKPLFDTEHLTAMYLFEFLKEKGLYNEDDQSFLKESGVYDFDTLKQITEPPNLSTFRRSNVVKDLPKLNSIVSYSKAKDKEETNNRSFCYKLTKDLCFSIENISITKNKINLFIPIPKYIPRRGAKLTKVLGNIKDLKYFVKLSFIHNLVDSKTLTNPNLNITIDSMAHANKIDENWFDHNNNPEFTNGDERKLKCWLSMNKLLNFLKEKEKSRLLNGQLKTNNLSPKYQYNLRTWITNNLKLFIDEQLSEFCNKNNITIISRSLQKLNLASNDRRVFSKFKLFKWYANSYDTFNFQLSSNSTDAIAYISCLKYLNSVQLSFDASGPTNYVPLGLRSFAGFSDANNNLESYMNMCNLFSFLLKHINNEFLSPIKDIIVQVNKHLNHQCNSEEFLVRNCIELIENNALVNVNEIVGKMRVKLRRETLSFEEMKQYLQEDNDTQSKHFLKLVTEQLRHIVDQYDDYVKASPVIGKRGYLRCIGEGDAKMDMLVRSQRLSKFHGLHPGDTIIAKCIVVEAFSKDNQYRGYWFEMDLVVDIVINSVSKVMVGDTILCTQVIEVDMFNDKIVLR